MGTGTLSFVGIIVILWIIVSVLSRRKLGSGMSTLVLRRFVLPEDPESDTLLYIVGRKSGIMGWLLTVAGISAETTLRVSKNDILFRDVSLSGSSDSLLSLKGGVASVHCAIHKPIGFLVLAVLFFLSGLGFLGFPGGELGGGGVLIVCLILVAVMLVLYHFNKKLRIMVQSKGGAAFGMSFKASLIENVKVDIDRVRQAVDRINAQVVLLQSK